MIIVNSEKEYKKFGLTHCWTLWPAITYQEYKNRNKYLMIYWLKWCLQIEYPNKDYIKFNFKYNYKGKL